MSIRKLKEHMSLDSALKVSKAISMASKRDLQNFDSRYANVLKIDELQAIEEYFNESCLAEARISTNFDSTEAQPPQKTESTKEEALPKSIKIQETKESILSLFGDDFYSEYSRIGRNLDKQEWAQQLKKDYGLSEGNLLIYATFLKTIDKKDYARKVFKPFISRTPESFLKCKYYLARLLSILRKFPKLEEGTYEVSTRQDIKYFKTGNTFVFPSFALGIKSDDAKEKKKGKGTTLKIKGKTSLGHMLEGDRKRKLFILPHFVHPLPYSLAFIINRTGYLRARGFVQSEES